MNYKLNFEGFWDVRRKQRIPNYKGIYAVFIADYQKDSPLVKFLKVLYIGCSENINQTINKKENILTWSKELDDKEQLLFSATCFNNEAHLDSVTSQLIYINQPLLNEKTKPIVKPPLTIKCTGMCYGLKQNSII